ncbi:uncharacterized protein A1O9_07453 [Exophiala aquamarina CBS 119918]|uniref:Xylanolytic transcriptional activator regulatory domain-containing protein n=1 Tax=Exophiala aquamarina CBS 119918 TaxID=1182545 RepID=A0A072P9D0_9EURO|nr:uncharacterized protein A1O9_07453 [Exophiala aquamarina CBS 119918]KEF55873.1 hypothetical protein A1O9_07453 [Exophiala aquamarina CBS 119918]
MPDTAPSGAQGYDWTEDTTLDLLADGMAALRVEPTGAGYLGAFLSNKLRVKSEARVQIETKLIDAYFENYHPVYPFVHEPTFRAQYHEILPRPVSASWKLLLSTVLALGSWSSGQTQTELDEQLYRRSISLGEDESIFEVANLTTIQALVLLSNLAQKRNRPNTGWNMLGLATRMALSLGLHREHPSWNVGILHQEMRRRVWWGLFLFDSGASTTFGRPILLPDQNSMDTCHILNIDDEVILHHLK